MGQLQMNHHQLQDWCEDHSQAWLHQNYDQHHPNYVPDFNYGPIPMEPIHSNAIHPLPQHPTSHSQLHPLIMPQVSQWPSMLTSQSSYVPPVLPSAPVPIAPVSFTPISATSTHSGHTSSTPRKTLTNADRRKMCQYHEDHPTVKQTEIGAMFGVERSTVSKVLRQKEKYVYQDDGSQSLIKRSKGKFPDIERALANWARNRQKTGLPLTDNIIREKAKFFATTVGNNDSHLKANSSSWLEKFKQKNNLLGSESRKDPIVEESEGTSDPPSNVHTPVSTPPQQPSMLQTVSEGISQVSPSQEEAARALELVWTFLQQQQQQHEGFIAEPQEYVTIGKLMEKLKTKRNLEALPSGMRRLSEPNCSTVDKIESVDPLH